MSTTKLFAATNSRASQLRVKPVTNSKLVCLLTAAVVVSGCDSDSQSPDAFSNQNLTNGVESGSILSTRADGEVRLPTAVSAKDGLELLENNNLQEWPDGWSSCHNNSAPGFSSGNLVIPAHNCIQQVVRATPGDDLELTCEVGLTPSPSGWTGVGLSFYDQHRNFISEPHAPWVRTTHAQEFNVAGTVPHDAAFALAWIYTDSGAFTRRGAGCSLKAVGAHVDSNSGNSGRRNLLSNAGFDQVANGSVAGWTDYCSGHAHTIHDSGDTGVEIAGACLTQSLDASDIAAIKGNNIRLTCEVERTGGHYPYASVGTNLLTGQHSEELIPQRDGRFDVTLSGRAAAHLDRGYVSVNGSARIYDCALEITDENPQPQNQPPVANDDTFEFDFFTGGNTLINLPIFDNDFDPEGQLNLRGNALTIIPETGILPDFTIGSDGLFFDLQSPVDTTFRYTIDDFQGIPSNEATVTFTFPNPDGLNARPVANLDEFTLAPGVVRGRFDVLANDFDPEGSALEVEVFGQPGQGIIESIENGVITYLFTGTINPNGLTTDGFSYRITDADGAVSEETFATIIIQ